MVLGMEHYCSSSLIYKIVPSAAVLNIDIFVFMRFYFSLFQEFTDYFHLNNLGISTENIRTQITSKRVLIQRQNFKVITMQTKNKRG